MPRSIISTGTLFQVYDSSVEVHGEELPLGTYRVEAVPLSKPALRRIDDLSPGSGSIYGNHVELADHMIRTYGRSDRSMGILASGDKGMGKSLMLRVLAEKVRLEQGLSTIVVSENMPGIVELIEKLGEVVVVFDEFEKVFPSGRFGGEDHQQQFLGLFDGLSQTKRLYIVTINEIDRVSDYLVNRPGRFHYHLRFSYPEPDQVRAYMRAETPGISDDQVEEVVAFSRRANLNYDHLRSIAFEMQDGAQFSDIIDVLNIKRISDPAYRIDVTLSGGGHVRGRILADLFSPDPNHEVCFRSYHQSNDFDIRFPVSAIIQGATGRMTVRGQDVSLDDVAPGIGVEEISIAPEGQTLLTY